MTTHLVTFSDDQMSRSRRLCIESALKHGVDCIAGPHYFDPALETRDGFTLEWLKSQPIYGQMGADWWTQRGIGYWLWKPYIIELVMSKLSDRDVLVYSDAGVEFIDNIRHIIDRMDQDVFLFGNNWEHAHWCKADAMEWVWLRCWRPASGWEAFGKQCQASVIFIRVSDYTCKFVRAWLDYCLFQEGRLIDDSPSRLPNHPEFREHRHDQAILTTLAYREGIKLHWWGSVYNRFVGPEFIYEKLPCYADDAYPPIFHHHRLRDHEFNALRPNADSAVIV